MFKKRETVIQNISYIALMSAINVIFVLLTTLFAPLMFILVFILPLASAVVTLFCKKRYYPIYLIVTIGLCFAISFGVYFYDTITYVIPSLITGFLFGLLIEKKLSGIHILTLTTLAQYVLTYITFIMLNAIVSGVNFFDVLLSIFGLQNFQFKEIFVHVFCFLLAAIQNLFAYIIIKFEIKKLGLSINLYDNNKYLGNIISISFIILAIAMYFVYEPLTYIFIFVAMYYFAYQLIQLLLTKKIKNYVILSATIFTSIFLFAFLYQYPIKPMSIILLSIPFGLVNIIHFVNSSLTKN